MREMKDSGIEWVGKMPVNWRLTKIKYISDINSGEYIDKDSYDNDGLYPIVGSNGVIGHCNKYNNKRRVITTGRVGSVGTAHLVDVAWITDNTLIIEANDLVRKKYLYYVLPNFDYQFMSSGTAQPLITASKLKQQAFAIPSVFEQDLIVGYLDSKCAEIDALTADIEKQIETLEAYKRSVITEAVTKGLNPDVEMKDSGTEWLGMIPSSWEISRIGSVYALRNTKVSDYDYQPLSVTMKGIVPQLETAAKTNAHDDRKLVKTGDFAINSRSDRRGSCGIAPMDGSVSLINTILKPLNKMNPRYYNWLFHTEAFADEFYKWGHGIVDDLWTTGWQEMKRILIPFPSMREQEQIAAFLDDKCAVINNTLIEKQQQLETLAEYKKSLIYEYVTGKKEVPV